MFAFAVAERRREMAVRMALGATRAAILKLVIGDGLRVALIGLAIGVPAATWAAHALRHQLADVSGATPATLVAAVVLMAVSAAACAIPARRASTVELALALRSE